MSRNIFERYIKNFDVNLLDCKFLGMGHNGVVYMLPEGKVVKICYEPKSCIKEYYILHRVNSNKYFPRVYGMSGNYMVRDYVDGVSLKNYIRERGLDRDMIIKILIMFEEFKKLKFTKEDIRVKDIMVQPDGSLMIIDPKKCYSKKRDFPRHLIKGFCRLGVLDYFLEVVKEEKPHLYRQWKKQIEVYLEEKKEEFGIS